MSKKNLEAAFLLCSQWSQAVHLYPLSFTFVPIYKMGVAISVFSNQFQRSAVKPLQMNAPSIREVLLYSSKLYQQSQFSLEHLEVDSLISTSLPLERYMGLMINLSGPCCSAQLFFTVIRTQIWRWISISFKHDFIVLHKENCFCLEFCLLSYYHDTPEKNSRTL